MVEVANPALDAFIAQIGPESVFGQVLVCRQGERWELRQVADRETAELKTVSLDDLRALAAIHG